MTKAQVQRADHEGEARNLSVEEIDSASDDRTMNNVARHSYRVLNEQDKEHMTRIKDKGVEFLQACQAAGKGRELAIAETKIEEAIMWAVKGLTR